MIYVFKVEPMGKPRMTRSDKWKKRDCVVKYWDFKNKVVSLANEQKFTKPTEFHHIVFQFKMPDSWGKKKKEQMNGMPHLQKPDKDNCEKAFLDSLFKDDSDIWDNRCTKIWGHDGRIVVYTGEDAHE